MNTKAQKSPRLQTAIAVTELPGVESLLGEEVVKSIFLSPNAMPGRSMPREHHSKTKRELRTGPDGNTPAGLVIYLEI